MGNYTILRVVENARRGRQARNLTTNVPKILDLKSSSEQIFSKNRRWVPLTNSIPSSFLFNACCAGDVFWLQEDLEELLKC